MTLPVFLTDSTIGVVERIDKARVDHFGRKTMLLLQFGRGFERTVERGANRDNGNVAARAANGGFAQLDFVIIGRYALL